MTSPFRPAWWLPGPHLQTLWPRLHRRCRLMHYVRRERVELPDGDFVDLDWAPGGEQWPQVLILHGLEGSSRSPYVRGLATALHARGLRAVALNFRGCGGEPNRLPRAYHSGDTADIAAVVARLREASPGLPLAAVGYSLGANALLKWLGESGRDAPLAAAAAVSVPFQPGRAADRLGRGASRLYQWALLRGLRRSLRRKAARMALPVDLAAALAARSFRVFDGHVTAPLHGFVDAADYYARAACRPWLRHIHVPTLIVQSADDPFLPADALPLAAELSPQVTLELSRHGGHVGFVAGRWPWRPHYWLDERLAEHLAMHIP